MSLADVIIVKELDNVKYSMDQKAVEVCFAKRHFYFIDG